MLRHRHFEHFDMCCGVSIYYRSVLRISTLSRLYNEFYFIGP